MKKRLRDLGIMLMLIGATAVSDHTFAQNTIKSGEWVFKPKIQLTNNLYPMEILSFVLIQTEHRWNLANSLETPTGKAKVRYWDWRWRNYALGFSCEYQPFGYGFGVEFGLNYEKQSMYIKFPDAEDYSPFVKHMTVPSAMVYYKTGGISDKHWIVGAGTSFDWTFKATRTFNSTKEVNNGFTPALYLAYQFPEVSDNRGIKQYLADWTIYLKIEKQFYNFFNEDYSFNGIQPYNGWETNRSFITIGVKMKLFL